jgi:transcriptional regulator with XRE-family HTH domain
MPSNKEIGARLRSFAEGRYKSMVAFAESLGVSASQINDYLSGRRTPGNTMQSRLRDLGCDIEWLMTGKRSIRYRDSQKTPAVGESLYELSSVTPLTAQQRKKFERLARRLRKLSAKDLDKVDELLGLFFKDKKG